MIDYFKCLEEHECFYCNETCGCYGDCKACVNEFSECCEKCVYQHRKEDDLK